MNTDFDCMVEDVNEAKLIHREDMLMELTELICQVMAKEGVSRAQLAERLKVSKSAVSQMLNGEGRNLTVNKVSDALFALGYGFVALPRRVDEPRCEYIPIRVRSVWSHENQQAMIGVEEVEGRDGQYTATRCDIKDLQNMAA